MAEEKSKKNVRLTWKDPRSEEETRQTFALPLTIGRDSSNLLKIPSPSISRQHARLELDGDQIKVTDLGSSNGSSINGKTISPSGFLKDGDLMKLGMIDITVEVVEGRGSGQRPSMDRLYDALYEGESQPTISLSALDHKDGLFAAVEEAERKRSSTADIFAKLDKAHQEKGQQPAATEEKLSGDALKAFISGSLQKDMDADIADDVEVLAQSHKERKSKPDDVTEERGITKIFSSIKRLFGG